MMRFLCILLVSLALGGCGQDARSQEPPEPAVEASERTALNTRIGSTRRTAITHAVEEVSPAVVSVNVIEVQRYRNPAFNDPFFEFFFGPRRSRVMKRRVEGIGSGFVISPDGYIVTNDHVAGDAAKISVSFPDGRILPARLVGTDPVTDIALLKVDPEEPLPYLEFSDDGPPLVGEWAVALGNPFGLFEAAEPTVTVGVVSAVGRNLGAGRGGHVYRNMIQTDAAINRGNSGGPLVNALGEVIGVNTAIYSRSGGSVGLGFAVPAARAQRIVRELRERGYVDRSYYTGLSMMDVTPRVAQVLGLAEARGVLVRSVDPRSPGARAGLQAYDVIVSIGGEPVEDREDFQGHLFAYRPGDRVGIGFIREGERGEVTLHLGSRRG